MWQLNMSITRLMRLVPNFTCFEVTTGLVCWSQIKIRYMKVLVICLRQHVNIMEPNFIPLEKNRQLLVPATGTIGGAA